MATCICSKDIDVTKAVWWTAGGAACSSECAKQMTSHRHSWSEQVPDEVGSTPTWICSGCPQWRTVNPTLALG